LIASVLAAVLTMLSNLGRFSDRNFTYYNICFDWFWLVQIIDNNLSQPIIFLKVLVLTRNISCNPYSGLPFGILE
jgi:hypothetical protein